MADFAPDDCSSVTWTALAVLAVIALISRNSFAIYAFVSASFFVLHSLRTTDLPYAQLIRELGNEPRPVTVHGTVAREPKMAPSGIASFFLEAESIEIDGVERPCHVTFLARWRASVELGDEVRLFGTAEPIGFPRNPGRVRSARVPEAPGNSEIASRSLCRKWYHAQPRTWQSNYSRRAEVS